MVLSVLGYVIVDFGSGNENKKEYNGYKFLRLQNGWRGNINGENILFNYFPQQVEDLKIIPAEKNSEAVNLLQNNPLIAVSYDPGNKYAQDLGALQYYIEQSIKGETRFVAITLTNNTKYPQIQQATCMNASQKLPIIILNIDTQLNDTQIKYENGCITATAKKTEDIYKTTDKLIYLILKVMNQ